MHEVSKQTLGDANAPGHLEQVYTIYSYMINDEIYENTATDMDKQKQTDYAVKPREDTIMMHTLYNSYTIVIL